MFPEKLTTRAQWIVGRSQCIYRIFPTSALPSKNKEDALALLVKRWAPFAKTGFHAVWFDNIVGVWAWDQDKVDQHIEEVGVQAISTLPESVYYPKQSETVACWQASVDGGFTFQLWNNGNLVAEKWFANKPADARFTLFLRSIEQPTANKLDWDRLQQLCLHATDSNTTERLSIPWGAKSKNWSIVQKLPWEHSLLLFMLCCLSAAYLWVITSTVLTSISLQQVKDRSEAAAQDVESILTARSQAETLNNKAASLIELIDYPSQGAMMADAAKVLTRHTLILKGWDFSGGSLEIISEGKVNTLDVVKEFEKLDWIQSVSVSSLRNNAQNKFTLNIQRAG
ncbi:hypothetical protein DRW07_02525 [Alteromonas sediminis]|uniref:Uncharacterized protein n=1 Tax=Alteromonas sediminis TaxID=2259342 RepID=A0A3N5YQD2_9ALTE|nr:hypothetical protein [Alteromonas sediminis]RPJ68301.1 hypothetical protein DRW07_02525 [Alteromonas sediminis]